MNLTVFNELERVLMVPSSIVLKGAAYAEFMRENHIYQSVDRVLDKQVGKHFKVIQESAQKIRRIISCSPIPDDLYSEIQASYYWLGAGRVVLSPVEALEDIIRGSGARQGPLMQEAGTLDEVLRAIKSLWASPFTAEAMFYRELNGLGHSDAKVVLVIQHIEEA